MYKKCLICKKEFYTKPSRIKVGRGKYCSRHCCNISRLGIKPWNKGIKYSDKQKKKFELKCQFTSEEMKGRNNPKWLGDKVGYFGLHSWVTRILGHPKKCDICGTTNGLSWANK